MSSHCAQLRKRKIEGVRNSEMGLAIENAAEAHQSLNVQEVLAIKREGNHINYLVLLDNQATQLLPSELAKQLCPNEIIQFYVRNCRLERGQLHVPKQFHIDA